MKRPLAKRPLAKTPIQSVACAADYHRVLLKSRKYINSSIVTTPTEDSSFGKIVKNVGRKSQHPQKKQFNIQQKYTQYDENINTNRGILKIIGHNRQTMQVNAGNSHPASKEFEEKYNSMINGYDAKRKKIHAELLSLRASKNLNKGKAYYQKQQSLAYNKKSGIQNFFKQGKLQKTLIQAPLTMNQRNIQKRTNLQKNSNQKFNLTQPTKDLNNRTLNTDQIMQKQRFLKQQCIKLGQVDLKPSERRKQLSSDAKRRQIMITKPLHATAYDQNSERKQMGKQILSPNITKAIATATNSPKKFKSTKIRVKFQNFFSWIQSQLEKEATLRKLKYELTDQIFKLQVQQVASKRKYSLRFSLADDEFDPFYVVEHPLNAQKFLQKIMEAQKACEINWKLAKKLQMSQSSINELYESFNFQKKEQISLRTLVREISLYTEQPLRNRDLFALYQRVKPLTRGAFRDWLS